MAKCGEECEVYSRIVGYFRPINDWNIGKKEEFKERKNFSVKKANLRQKKTKLATKEKGD